MKGTLSKLNTQWSRLAILLVTVLLLSLGVANVVIRATWQEAEDGVLWLLRPQGVVAAEIASGSPAEAVGLTEGDVLLAIDGQPVQTVSDVVDALHAQKPGSALQYTLLRLGTRDVIAVQLAPIPNGTAALYYLLAIVGSFTLFVGAAVRFRRPKDPATLHFFWLAVAFFGVFTFSFNGRLDRLDWIFYWGDVIAILLLPPMFTHFVMVFPERSNVWRKWTGRGLLTSLYLIAATLGGLRVATFVSGESPIALTSFLSNLDRLQPLFLAICLVSGLVVLASALRNVQSITARRQLQWIAWGTALGATPFVLLHAVPYAIGIEPSFGMQLSVLSLGLIPLSYACAIVRYKLMDVEIIVKRTLVYTAALSVVLGITALLLQAVEQVFVQDNSTNWVIAMLATLVALLLAPPVKEAIQVMLDRAFYRDRYDYRQALVGFARDLNSDLDLHRLAERLVSRVIETLLIERMALMLTDQRSLNFKSLRSFGFSDDSPSILSCASNLGKELSAGNVVAFDDPVAVGRFSAEEIEFWRDAGLYYFIPCVFKENTIAVLALSRKDSGKLLSSEDMALLTAVAGQIATALDNARLYRQLHSKASELDRMRVFSENILDSLHDGLVVVDLNDRILRWNSAFERMYGLTSTDTIGHKLDQFFDLNFLEAMRKARTDVPTGTTLSRIPITARGDNQDRGLLVNIAVAPLRSVDGNNATVTVGTIIVFEDITSRAQLEEQLQVSEKMASIGVLVAGVAHEVNTPLTGISSFTQMLLKRADPESSSSQLLKKIERQTFRAAKIVNSLLNLSRPATATDEHVPFDINTIIGDVLTLLEHQFAANTIKIVREPSPQPALVLGSESKLQQIFLNLFLNALDAMPRGGWLSITTRFDGNQIGIEVSDTGHGIAPEHLARIYDPFFTTKATGQSIGLGLSITYGIVKEHKGSLVCESTIGKGTCFTIEFPKATVDELRSIQAVN